MFDDLIKRLKDFEEGIESHDPYSVFAEVLYNAWKTIEKLQVENEHYKVSIERAIIELEKRDYYRVDPEELKTLGEIKKDLQQSLDVTKEE